MSSWTGREAAQQIAYPDQGALNRVTEELAHYPPLVFPGEVDELRSRLARAVRGEAFVLQGGDCVERFGDCTAGRIADRIKILLQMSVVLTYAARMPVLRVGRIAGQFFKPRSRETEEIGGREVLTYRGDPVHQFDPGPDGSGRAPRPERLLDGYFHAAATLNYIRAMISGGFADLHDPRRWDLSSMRDTPQWEQYRHIVDRILDAIQFMESFGGIDENTVGNVRFFTSHEALHLPWEAALTRTDPATEKRYNLAAHTVWLGARTADLDGAHVAYLCEVCNPIGIKVAPDTTPDQLVALLDRLDPDRSPGRISLITRLGRDRVAEKLPHLIRAVAATDHPVLWMVDPMHGNTESTAGGHKTRRFEAVLQELSDSFAVHAAEKSRVNGVHFELTGDDVTECTGGAVPLGDDDLHRRYESWCDPRLNYTQSMEMAFLMASLLPGGASDAGPHSGHFPRNP
ncbi:MAG: 3-deoxy-7-phosphoheptulonate synthase class II [Spirochaeta sp.]|jgi:3-deoxy-7-phosphoheptulonate synthase|nr:3-deoxy-7-phosphoheptulonate synthase class II [Spirochaeta sp.]